MQQISKKKSKQLFFGVILVFLLVFLDQFTKYLAVIHLKDAPAISIISKVFELSYLENQGAAFGILQGQKSFFVLVTCVSLMILIYLYVKIPDIKRYGFMRFVLLLLISGAIGNFIDRCVRNYVVDFFYFKWIDFPIFNVADIYVTTAAALLILLFCFYYKEEDIDMILKQLTFWKKEKH